MASLSAEAASRALRAGGFALSPQEVTVEAREDRCMVRMPADTIAWFPANEQGKTRLAMERQLLRILAERCSFRVPRLLFESDTGLDIRAAVPGPCDPWGLFERVRADSGLAQRIGRSLGAILAEQHTRVRWEDVAGFIPLRVPWPEPSAWIRIRLPSVIDDRRLLARIDTALQRYDDLKVEPSHAVLVHGDLGLHNIALDPASDDVRGVFDYDGAAWDDRHHDFRYLVFDIDREDMLAAALAEYEPALGIRIDRERVDLYNALCAISYLAFRAGVPAEQRWCGRTFAEDRNWVEHALAKVE
jgi:hypothetical protein